MAELESDSESGSDYVPSEVEESDCDEQAEPAKSPENACTDSTGTDDLWSDFLADTDTQIQPKQKELNTEKKEYVKKETEQKVEDKPASSSAIANILDSIEESSEEKEKIAIPNADKKSQLPQKKFKTGGLASAVSLVNKNKPSVLKKSHEEWEKFKKEEGLEEALVSHNRGKDGFLIKQDFLDRSDLRQFELERNARAKRRKMN